ncbi:MAG: TonB family protein [Ignavibacteria bacterium]|jgi:protein TonB|nr:TonB family protein [Ignavibacteria bacterium]MDH7526629.1 TonB family protein [Ignavibacteria bacterium]
MKRFLSNRRNAFIVSFLLHTVLLIFFSFVTLGTTIEELEYVTVDFGSPGSGKMGESPLSEKANTALEEQKEISEESKQKVETPKIRQEFDEVIQKNNKPEEDKRKIERAKQSENISRNVSKNSEGDQPFGSSGYSFDWGGRGTRKILRWEKPKFPEGVQKEIDIKIKFTILPDGSVVSPVPLIKADTQLEDAAIQALKTWKFEPLRPNQIQFEQTVIITIPYRLE